MIDPRILLGQLLRAREVKVPVNDRITLTIVRPTPMELDVESDPSDVEGKRLSAHLIQTKVIAWEGVLENDVVPGGASDALPFDAALYRQWISDRKDLWPPLVEAFIKAIEAHKASVEAVKGN